jgi:hypothetical protein
LRHDPLRFQTVSASADGAAAREPPRLHGACA